jgi:hypothetical protein
MRTLLQSIWGPLVTMAEAAAKGKDLHNISTFFGVVKKIVALHDPQVLLLSHLESAEQAIARLRDSTQSWLVRAPYSKLPPPTHQLIEPVRDSMLLLCSNECTTVCDDETTSVLDLGQAQHTTR